MASIRTQTIKFCAALLCVLLSLGAYAQTATPGATKGYPTKPIRLVVPFPPGASSDVVGRMLAQKMTGQLGQQVIADNRSGVAGNLGIGTVAKSAPDGYTIVIATASVAVSPALYKNLGYDPVKDLAPVARLTSIPNMLIIHPSVPAKTLRQFIELARASPGKLNFGSGGTGTTNHLANELLKHLANINIVHVPYKGVTVAMTAMLGGEVDEVVMPVTTAIPQLRAGKVRALAVLTPQRIAALPDVPTGIEAGVKDFVMPLWYGVFAPAGTPREIVARLNGALLAALKSPDTSKQLIAMGVDPWPGTAEELGAMLRADIARYGAIVRSAGLPQL